MLLCLPLLSNFTYFSQTRALRISFKIISLNLSRSSNVRAHTSMHTHNVGKSKKERMKKRTFSLCFPSFAFISPFEIEVDVAMLSCGYSRESFKYALGTRVYEINIVCSMQNKRYEYDLVHVIKYTTIFRQHTRNATHHIHLHTPHIVLAIYHRMKFTIHVK